MSLLQCIGCQQKRRTVQPLPSVLIARQHIHDARKLIARIDKEFNNLGIDKNNLPNNNQANDDATELERTLTGLKNRLSRINQYISNTPENTRPVDEHQWNPQMCGRTNTRYN